MNRESEFTSHDNVEALQNYGCFNTYNWDYPKVRQLLHHSMREDLEPADPMLFRMPCRTIPASEFARTFDLTPVNLLPQLKPKTWQR